ncbi:MAG: PExPT-CTERM protein [Acidobacteriaceae bacterium]|nr:PExPT-CTERM protein [Acidobacteriaceae bacterium]
MKKTLLSVLSVVFVLSVAAPAFAQGGCVNSPENPTAILMLVGSAGAAFAALRGRFRR